MRLAIALFSLLPFSLQAISFTVPQVADGTSWKTSLTVFARSFRGAQATVYFLDASGTPMTVPVAGLGPVSSVPVILGPFDAYTIETLGTSSTLQVGWALVESEQDIGGVAVFRQRVSGRPDYEAAVPFTVPTATVMSSFDNTAGFSTGIALVNNFNGPITINIGFTAEGGTAISTRVLTMNPRTHTSFSLPERFPELAGKRGTIHLISQSNPSTIDGSISVLGLRFSPGGAFTTLPFFVTVAR